MDPVLAEVSALAMLRIVVGANVGVALLMLVGVGLWLLCGWRDLRDLRE